MSDALPPHRAPRVRAAGRLHEQEPAHPPAGRQPYVLAQNCPGTVALILSWSRDTGDRRRGGRYGRDTPQREAGNPRRIPRAVQPEDAAPGSHGAAPPGQGDPTALVARAQARCTERRAAWGAVRGHPGKTRHSGLSEQPIATQDGVTIRYTGAQLDQADLDVWEQALHLVRTQALGTECHFTEKGFLKALGRQTGKSDRTWLRSAISRLTAATVEISNGRLTYGGSLVSFSRDEDTGHTVLEINPKLARFFSPTRWTQIDWEQRQQLRGKPLALWLHGFYASHAAPYPLTVEYLHKLSGSQTKQLKHFKQNLTQALWDLEAAGAIKSFEIRDDLVHVRTVPSKSQQKHLVARRPPARRRR